MADPIIKSVNQTPRVQDVLKKRDSNKRRPPQAKPKSPKKKDSKRIIDTYA